MPAIDSCEPSIIRALEKAAWTILQRPFYVATGDMAIFPDFSASRIASDVYQRIIIVEVKCFAQPGGQQDELYRAIGQYIVYRSILLQEGITDPLYLAVPQPIYDTLFTSSFVATAVQAIHMRLIVVALDREEVELWTDEAQSS